MDGEDYRWRIRQKPAYWQGLGSSGLRLAIESVAGDAARVVEFDAARPVNWVSAESVVVQPADVARVIRSAREKGWSPECAGGAFEVRESELQEE